MKKLLLFALLALASQISYAQSGRIFIRNHTDFDVEVVMYAEAPVSCGAGCSSTFITNPILLPAPFSPLPFPSGMTDWGPFDPCSVDAGVGWASAACTTTWCPGTGIPSDFQWSLAKVNLDFGAACWTTAPFPVFVSPRQPMCLGAGPTSITTGGCGSYPNLSVNWYSLGGPYADVAIVIDQY